MRLVVLRKLKARKGWISINKHILILNNSSYIGVAGLYDVFEERIVLKIQSISWIHVV